MTMPPAPPSLVGCGILHKEIRHLCACNDWPLETTFLDPGLDTNMTRLGRQLTDTLARQHDRSPIVFYGCCHPLIDRMVADAGTFRTEGRNCIEMLLGRERFDRELADGAYFLLEDWARRWDRVMAEMFGPHQEIAAEIFAGDRTHILAVRTPCSSDFTAAAEHAAASVALPLRWTDAGLDHLERVLAKALDRLSGAP